MIWRADLQNTLVLFVIAFHPLDHPLACTWPIAFYFSKNSEFLSFLWPGNPCKRNSRVSVQAAQRQSAFQRRYSLRELHWESVWQTRACAEPVRLCLPEVSHWVLALFSLLFCCWLLVICTFCKPTFLDSIPPQLCDETVIVLSVFLVSVTVSHCEKQTSIAVAS